MEFGTMSPSASPVSMKILSEHHATLISTTMHPTGLSLMDHQVLTVLVLLRGVGLANEEQTKCQGGLWLCTAGLFEVRSTTFLRTITSGFCALWIALWILVASLVDE